MKKSKKRAMASKKDAPSKTKAADSAVETCPACTSAVDAKADSCPQCGADLAYFRAAKDSASE